MRRRRNLLRFLTAIAVVAAGTAVVGRAAGLSLSSVPLGAVQTPVPTCPAGSVSVAVAATHRGDVTALTLTLTAACTGAASGDRLYAVLENTSLYPGTNSISDGYCTLAGSSCTVSRLSVHDAWYQTYAADIFTEPGTTGTATTSANKLALVSQDLTLTTCTSTGIPTTC